MCATSNSFKFYAMAEHVQHTYTAEGESLRKHYGELAELLSHGDAEWLATELYSSSMITFETLDDTVTTIGVSCRQKARRLLCAVQRSLAGQQAYKQGDYFTRFLAILKKEQTLHWLSNRIEATYSKSRAFSVMRLSYHVT